MNSSMDQVFMYRVDGNITLEVASSQSVLYHVDDDALKRRLISDSLLVRHLIPALVYIIILLMIGIPGNALVCYVYHQKWRKHRKTSTLFILALSWFDLINTLVTLPFEITLLNNLVNFDHPFICKFARYVTFFMNASSSVVLMGIAIDRFIGIWCSYRTRPFGISRAKGTIGLALFLALITCWPSLILYGTKTTNYNGIELKSCGLDDKFQTDLRRYPFIYGLYLLSSNIIIDSVFIVIYSLIGSKIIRRRRFGNNTQTPNRVPTSFVFTKKRPSLYSFTSSTYCDEETMSLTCTSRNKINYIARLIKEGEMNNSDPNIQRYGSLKRSYKTRCKFPSTYSVPEEEINNLKPNEQNAEKQRFLQVDRPVRSASLPNCNMIVQKDNQTSSKPRTWTFRHLPRTVSNMSHASSTDNTPMGRYGRTFHTGKTTFMLFLVTLAYILTFVPFCIIYILRISDESYYHKLGDAEKNVYQLFLRSYLLSSAINPIIYSFLNMRFRKECFAIIKNIFCVIKLRCRRKETT